MQGVLGKSIEMCNGFFFLCVFDYFCMEIVVSINSYPVALADHLRDEYGVYVLALNSEHTSSKTFR